MRRLLLPVTGLLVLGALFSNGTAQTRKKKAVVAKKTTPPVAAVKPPAGPAPFMLDPLNPRTFRFRGQTVVLTGASERYTAVQNPNFDFRKYLDSLAEDHLNAVRIIDGTYVESGEPYLSPWVGAAGKYDTSQFEPKYFDRLKSFISEAGLRNIVVNLTLFSTMYGTGKGYGVWAQSPLFSAKVNWDRFNTLEDSALTAAQDALIRKTAAELNSLDNFYFTVCNDCKYSGATAKDTAAWVEHMTATVRDAESKLPNKHLIVDAMPQFRATGINAAPCKALEIRREAWVWMFANGGAYTTLDPSFTAQTPEGPSCKESRIQLGVLQNFLRQFNLIALKPDADAVRQWALGASDAWTLSDPGRTYAVYLRNPGTETRKSILLMDLPAGKWQIEWWNPRTGDQDKAEPVEHKGGSLRILTPGYTDDLAMKLTLQVPPPEPKEPSAKKTAAPVKKPAR